MLPTIPGVYAIDGNGFAPPDFGGNEATMYVTFDKTATTGATVLTLPPFSTIVGMSVFVKTVFSGGTVTLSVGHAGSTTFYLNADATILGTAGPTSSTNWRNWYAKLTNSEPLTLTVGANNTAGSAIFAVRYVLV